MPIANDIARIRAHEAVRFLNAHRVFFYALVSLLTVSAVITNALKNYSNFYSVAIYLSKSSRSVLVLANFGVLLTLLCGHVVQRIFFGSLRANEVERLYDRLWFFITESLLAFTIFRDEFDTPFALMFGFLLFVKSFHWLASDRIEWMDQRPYPGPPLLFHFRMTILFAILWMTDFLMFLFAVEHTLSVGVGGMVLFASEYGILMASVMNTILKYLLSAYDLRRAGRRGGENAPPWENKSMWTFYIELATDFLKLTTYLVFFIIIISYYGLPLNIVRDVYITARSFLTRLRALHRYQTATRNMDERYPNATEVELTSMSDRTCIICREEMVSPVVQEVNAQPDGPNTTPKKLPCGHIFHFHCLRSWLERQQSCPTCRRNVLDEVNNGAQAVGRAVPGQRPDPANLQQGNQAAPQGVDGQNPQGGANNPLGMLGRLFAPPGRPAAPVQPNRQPLQNVNVNHGQAGGQQPGIFINYQVQYQFPRRQNDDNLQPIQQPQQHAPVPPYPGFPGPGGAWQAWPGEEDAAQPQASNEAPDIIPTRTSPETMASNSSSAPLEPVPALDISHDPSNLPGLQTRDETPREAAARAALGRLGSQNSTHSRPKEPASSLASVDSKPTPTTSTPSPIKIPPTSVSSTNMGESIRPPQLIPLFEFGAPGVMHRYSGQVEPTWLQNGYHSSVRETSVNGPFRNSTTQVSRPPHSTDSIASLSSQLPANLTDDQLATLDTLTRESIDERLRILEGVSGTVYRCIDDLMLLRSALPPTNARTVESSSGSHRLSASGSDSAPVTNHDQEVKSMPHGKGKEKEVNAPAASSETITGNEASGSSSDELL